MTLVRAYVLAAVTTLFFVSESTFAAAVESTRCIQQKTVRRRSQEMTSFRSHLLLAFVMGEVREHLEGIGLCLWLTIRLSRM